MFEILLKAKFTDLSLGKAWEIYTIFLSEILLCDKDIRTRFLWWFLLLIKLILSIWLKSKYNSANFFGKLSTFISLIWFFVKFKFIKF